MTIVLRCGGIDVEWRGVVVVRKDAEVEESLRKAVWMGDLLGVAGAVAEGVLLCSADFQFSSTRSSINCEMMRTGLGTGT